MAPTQPKPDAPKRYGLLFALPGAPDSPHVVWPVDVSARDPIGEFHPKIPVLIEAVGLDSAAAKALAADERIPLKLVEVKPDGSAGKLLEYAYDDSERGEVILPPAPDAPVPAGAAAPVEGEG